MYGPQFSASGFLVEDRGHIQRTAPEGLDEMEISCRLLRRDF
jgi:hypothetical protein